MTAIHIKVVWAINGAIIPKSEPAPMLLLDHYELAGELPNGLCTAITDGTPIQLCLVPLDTQGETSRWLQKALNVPQE